MYDRNINSSSNGAEVFLFAKLFADSGACFYDCIICKSLPFIADLSVQYVKLLELFMKSESEGPTQHSGIKAQGLVSEFHTVFKILYSFLSNPSLYLIIIS